MLVMREMFWIYILKRYLNEKNISGMIQFISLLSFSFYLGLCFWDQATYTWIYVD